MLRLLLLSIALLSPTFETFRIKVHHPQDVNQLIDEGVVNFGIKLNRLLVQHAQHEENVVFSPIGIYVTLALAHLGANGETRNEIADVMGLPKNSQQVHKIHENLGELIKSLQNVADTNVTIADGMFLQNGYEVKNSFKQLLHSYYNTQIVGVDFNSNDVTEVVNSWFSAKTHGKINQFYEENIPHDTKLLLANALCFNGNWDHYFPTESTQQETFNTENGEQQQITMMRKTENVPYYYDEQYKYEAIGIPYKQGEYQMYLVLPIEQQNLKNLADIFDYQHIKRIVSTSKPTNVDIKLPQMKIKTANKIEQLLMQLGINQLFHSPDLSNMVEQSNLQLSQVSCALELDVNEQGTDVCAGTAQQYKIRQSAAVDDDAAVKQFYAQKPYMFFIYHTATKSVLFYGNVYQIPNSV